MESNWQDRMNKVSMQAIPGKTDFVAWILVIAASLPLALAADVPPSPQSTTAHRTDPNKPVAARNSFVLRSPAVNDGGTLPVEYTGDGNSVTLPLYWSGAPAGTRTYAVIMHHIAPDKVKWYWILYNIPASVTSLPKNVKGIGIPGNNSVNGRTEYAPPHSKGPGPKTYVYTVYALSAAPKLDVPTEQVNRNVLLAAMKSITLASAELKAVYTRPAGATGPGRGPVPADPNNPRATSDQPQVDPNSPRQQKGW
jgi:Raf kinase inhibitor-like YbhB/YbcL family protein